MTQNDSDRQKAEIDPTYRPKCPECGDAVRAKLLIINNGERSYSWVHCGHYWTFEDQPTADEVMKDV